MSLYSEFFLSTSADVIQYDMLMIGHSSFSQYYWLTRNGPDQLDAGGHTWTHCPMIIEPNGVNNNLDFSVNITLGDVGTIIQQELENVRGDDTNLTYPTLVYWTYASNNLADPLAGPFEMDIKASSMTRQGATLECVPKVLHRNKTGMLYTPTNFPSLRGFL